jgi:hypothetical protein
VGLDRQPLYPPSRGVFFATLLGVIATFLVFFVVASAQTPVDPMGSAAQVAIDPDTAAQLATLARKLDENRGSTWSEWIQAVALPAVIVLSPLVMRLSQWKPTLTVSASAPVVVQLSESQMRVIADAASVAPLLAQIQVDLRAHGDEIKLLREIKHDFPNKINPLVMQLSLVEQRLDLLNERIGDLHGRDRERGR